MCTLILNFIISITYLCICIKHNNILCFYTFYYLIIINIIVIIWILFLILRFLGKKTINLYVKITQKICDEIIQNNNKYAVCINCKQCICKKCINSIDNILYCDNNLCKKTIVNKCIDYYNKKLNLQYCKDINNTIYKYI